MVDDVDERALPNCGSAYSDIITSGMVRTSLVCMGVCTGICACACACVCERGN